MDLLREIINTFGLAVLRLALTALAGYLGVVLKRLCNKYVNNETKKSVVKTCVEAVEQVYKNIHGEEKLGKCIEYVSAMLKEKGIIVTELEIRMLIEAAVKEMNSKLVPATDEH